MLSCPPHGDGLRCFEPPRARPARRRRRRLVRNAPRRHVAPSVPCRAPAPRGRPGRVGAGLSRRGAGGGTVYERVPGDRHRRPGFAARLGRERDPAAARRERGPLSRRLHGPRGMAPAAAPGRPPRLPNVGKLARRLCLPSSTLIARFRRARLPSPKAYLAGMRRLHAAYLFANPGLPVEEVANRLDYSGAQSLRKHLKLTLGLTSGEFRRRFPFPVALERYVELLITPYRETLRTFCPLNAGLWDQGSDVPRVSRKG